MTRPPRSTQLGLIACHVCGLVCEHSSTYGSCPRCQTPLHRRKHNSLAHTWALLIAAIIFYVPANVFPVMYTQMLGNGGDSTIMKGIIEFWHLGSWDIAAIIFIASVAVPCIKLLVLVLLLFTVKYRRNWAMRERAKLYRMIEFIGYWSMLDMLVVAIVSALVKFRSLSDIEPRIGILFFGLVVVLTMLAAMSFDPRFIWDGEEQYDPGQK